MASNTISRRGALKLLGGTALGLLTLPVLPSTALGTGKLEQPQKTSLGTFGGVEYFQYDGAFAGKTSTGNYRVPYRISAPANTRRANRTVLVEPPHFVAGTELGNNRLGRPFLFERRFLHASVAYSTASLGEPSTIGSLLDPVTKDGLFIDGGVVFPDEGDDLSDDEIVVDFARALASDPVAQALMGAVKQRYLAGLSQSARAVKRIVASGQAEGVFDLAVPITTDGAHDLLDTNDPQKAIADGRYSGKVIAVQSEFEWPAERPFEDAGTSPDQYRSFFVAGTPHVPDNLCSGHFANKTTPAGWQHALRAHFLQGHAWVTKGEAPPASTRLATTTIGGVTEEIARDSNKNAQVVDFNGNPAPRLAYVELGEATFKTGFTGTYEPQPPPTIEQLGFSSHPEYLAAFEEALNAQVQAGYMLDEDAQVLLKRAGLSPPSTFTENYHNRYMKFQEGQYCP